MFLCSLNFPTDRIEGTNFQAMTPLFKKLQFKKSPIILIQKAPIEFDAEMQEQGMFCKIDLKPQEGQQYDFILNFVYACAEIATLAQATALILSEDGGYWFAYPKKSSKKYKTDLGRDDSWQALGDLGYEGVRQVSIDEDWSALRFRKAENIKSLQRDVKRTMSAEGKKRKQ
jgi:hypothetical protein